MNATLIRKPLDIVEMRALARMEEQAGRLLREAGIPTIAGGAAGAWQAFDNARQYLLDGTFDLDTNAFKCALFLSTSNLTDASDTYAGLTNEHANQGAPGYETGGKSLASLALSSSGASGSKVEKWDNTNDADTKWTATGGSITAKFGVIYATVSGKLLCYCLLDSGGADVTATVGNDFQIQMNASGIFDLSGM